jgi:hypothetical protein
MVFGKRTYAAYQGPRTILSGFSVMEVCMSKHSGAEWIEEARKYWKGQDAPISDLGRDVADILGQVYGGIYHVRSGALSKVDWSDDKYMVLTISDGPGLATHDGCELADLVLLCFMMNVRLDIMGASSHYIRLKFCRVGRWGYFRDSHPTLDTAIKRNHNNLSDILKSREGVPVG